MIEISHLLLQFLRRFFFLTLELIDVVHYFGDKMSKWGEWWWFSKINFKINKNEDRSMLTGSVKLNHLLCWLWKWLMLGLIQFCSILLRCKCFDVAFFVLFNKNLIFDELTCFDNFNLRWFEGTSWIRLRSINFS